MKDSLLCPNQVRCNGVIVDDVPKHLSPNPQTATHSLIFPKEGIRIPLTMNGCISRLQTRLPSTEELENCQWLHLTGDLEWDPYAPTFQENEQQTEYALNEPQVECERSIFALRTNQDCPITQVLSFFDDLICDHEMHRSICNLAGNVITYQKACKIGSTTSKSRGSIISKEELGMKWNIWLTTAEQTLQVTMQKDIHNALHPISHRFRTKQAQLRYNQLGTRHGRFYSDTMFSNTCSSRGNTCAQVFTNDVRFTQVNPLPSKSLAGKAFL